jgi:hypothetical protein
MRATGPTTSMAWAHNLSSRRDRPEALGGCPLHQVED